MSAGEGPEASKYQYQVSDGLNWSFSNILASNRGSSVGRSLSRSAVRWEFVRIGDEGGGPSGHQMDRIHGGNISPARQFMRLRSGSVGSDTVRLGLPKKGTPADYLNGICGILCDTGFIDWLGHGRCWGGGSMQCALWFEVVTHTQWCTPWYEVRRHRDVVSTCIQ